MGNLSINQSRNLITWNGSVGPGQTVTITFRVRVLPQLRADPGEIVEICNQANLKIDENLDGTNETMLQTDDPNVAGTADPTCLPLTLRPFPRPRNLQFTSIWAYGSGIKSISVQVYSMTGKRVYASGWVANGHEWSLQNANERSVANGLYLYVVSVKGYDGEVQTQVKKLIIRR
jgi:hypothetical protein